MKGITYACLMLSTLFCFANANTLSQNSLPAKALKTNSSMSAQDDETNYYTWRKIKSLAAEKGKSVDGNINVIVEFSAEPLSRFSTPVKSSMQAVSANRAGASQQKALIVKQQADALSVIKKQGIATSYRRQFSRLYNGASLSIPSSKLSALKNIKGIKKVHIVQPKAINLADSVPLIHAPQVWSKKDKGGNNITGKGVKVAIVDTGVDYNRSELGGCFGDDCRVVEGYDFVNDDDDPMDDQGHGTHVAGIVAASGQTNGVAPDATLYAYKVCDYYCPTDGIIAALERALDPDNDPTTDDAADIVNMSLGGPGSLDDPLSVAVNNLASEDVLVVNSAGNEGRTGVMTIGSPGNAEKALTVAATDKYDNIADYSSRGPVLNDSFQKPEIAAPGSFIISLALGDGLENMSGTSMAAPHVAGAAALVKQRYPDLTGQQIKSLLINNTTQINHAFFEVGAGRLNALAAVEADAVSDKGYLLFKRLDRTQASWTDQATVALKNLSDKAITLNFTFDNDETAIQYSLEDTSQITLQEGESVSLPVTVTVNTAELPQYDEFLHRAYLVYSNDEHQARLPLLLFDAAKLTWQANVHARSVWLEKNDGSITSFLEYADEGELYAPPGNYVISSVFDEAERVSWVVREVTVENQDIDVDVKTNDAKNEIKVASFTDHLGASREVTSLTGTGVYMELAHPTTRRRHVQFFRDWSNEPMNGMFISKPVYASDFSDEFELTYSFLAGDSQTPDDDYHMYLHTGSQLGLSDNVDISLDGQLKSKATFNVLLPEELGREYDWMLYSNLDPYIYGVDWYDIGAGVNGPLVSEGEEIRSFLDKSFRLTFHGNNRMNERTYYNLTLFPGNTSSFDRTNLQPFNFYDDGFFFTNKPSIELSASYQVSAEGAYLLANLSNWNNTIYGSFPVNSGLFTQFNPDTIVNSAMLWCDGTATYAQQNDFWGFSVPNDMSSDCDNAGVIVYYSNYLNGVEHQSRVSMSIPNPASNNASIKDIDLTSLLNGDAAAEGKWKATAKLTTGGASLEDIEVRAYINYKGDWQQIDVNLTDEGEGSTLIELDFPVLEEAYVTSLKLEYQYGENQGSTLISNAFVLGGSKEEAAAVDRDGDGISNLLDDDKDNDGIPDGVELSNGLNHLDASDASKDLDQDGVSNLDEYLAGSFISMREADRDGDGTPDHLDAFPDNAFESVDTDDDGIGNNADSDDDNDGVEDALDAFPLDPLESIDSDNDGIGNNADPDDDNDGVEDALDAFPLDPTEVSDSDGDGIGNNADTDDDNDGVADYDDVFPLDPSETLDTDSDGIGNNADPDDDNDGVADTEDAYPLDAARSAKESPQVEPASASGSSGGSFGIWSLLMFALLYGLQVTHAYRSRQNSTQLSE